MKSRWVWIPLLCCIVSAGALLAAGPDDFKGELPHAVVLEDGLMGGGAPTETAIRTAAGEGYKTIIDLRMPEEGTESEKAVVQKYDLEYVNIPTSAENLSRGQADQLNEVLSQKNKKPAILHCASGNRAAAVWAAYRRFHQGEASDQALAAASAKGLKPNLKDRLAGLLTGEWEIL